MFSLLIAYHEWSNFPLVTKWTDMYIICNYLTVTYLLQYCTMGNCEEELPKKPVGRLSADCRPTVGRQLAARRPTGFARNIGWDSS